MSISSAALTVIETIGIWLNPSRKERVILLEAIEAAEQLLMILRKQGRYTSFSIEKLKEYEIHYQKRFDAWKDGTS